MAQVHFILTQDDYGRDRLGLSICSGVLVADYREAAGMLFVPLPDGKNHLVTGLYSLDEARRYMDKLAAKYTEETTHE